MFAFMSPDEAVQLIKDGDFVGINAFLTIANPEELHDAIYRRVRDTGHPKHLTMFCSAGFGGWREDSYCERYIALDAVDRVVAGHFGTMPLTGKRIMAGEMQGYNLPLGVMAHMIRAAAGKKPGVITNIGRNLFVDPKNGGGRLNEISKDTWVENVQIAGEELLFYKAPQFDVALIKGTSADAMGNISFEKECATVDALALAQATKANGGKVIVQVERKVKKHQRPRNVIIPGILVDAIVVCPKQNQIMTQDGYNPTYSGDVYVPPQEMADWLKHSQQSRESSQRKRDISHERIAYRAHLELREQNTVNIGIGIPEMVAVVAAKTGMLEKLTMTVESGAIGGLPASGYAFGATIGADVIYDMSQQIDFYDGGGLDICFVGCMEIDGEGNVNSHYSPSKITGIGGFANITQSTKKVIICGTFSSSGLVAKQQGDAFSILEEGKFLKFVPKVKQVSFSAMNAKQHQQEVLYVTERCVFQLCDSGLTLIEVAKGIDLQKDILDKLPFAPKIAQNLKIMPYKPL